jgi:hypothetical protein
MLKVLFTFLVLSSIGLAQSSSDGSFSVHDAKHPDFSLSKAEMREAESLYQSACAAVQREFHSTVELHPHFIVVIGAEKNEVHSGGMKVDGGLQIWMKRWTPTIFAQGVVVLAFQQLLTRDVITQLGHRAVNYANATVDVAGLK